MKHSRSVRLCIDHVLAWESCFRNVFCKHEFPPVSMDPVTWWICLKCWFQSHISRKIPRVDPGPWYRWKHTQSQVLKVYLEPHSGPFLTCDKSKGIMPCCNSATNALILERLQGKPVNMAKIEGWVFFNECICYGLSQWLSGEESTCNAGATQDESSIPASGRSPRGRHGNPLHYSCPEILTDRGARQTTGHRVAKSQTWLKRLNTHICTSLERAKKKHFSPEKR